jgi:septal ring factor EnvC (AmiA/AmiB activator)
VGEEAVVAGQREIETLEHDIEQSGQRLVRSARALYRFGRFAYIRLMFSLQEGAQPLPAFRQLRYLTQRDAASLALFRTAVAELKVQQAALAERQLELVGLVEAEREEASRLRREEQRLVALVERLEDRRRRIAAEVSTQETRSDRLGKLMETLAKEGPSGLNDDPIQQYRGGLDWPVEGRIATAFGSRRDPKYGTEVAHNGLELAVESPTSVRSVYPGRVIFAAPFQDLGFTVVLQHEDAVLTLYAGLEELLVAEGDVLALGDSVGSISDRLYFEIRQQRRPEDPVDWLR